MAGSQDKESSDASSPSNATFSTNAKEEEGDHKQEAAVRNLNTFVSLFLKGVESKLTDYKKEFSSGKYKDGRTVRLFPAISGVGKGIVEGVACFSGYGTIEKVLNVSSTAVLATIKSIDSSGKRNKQKKIAWLLYMEEIETNTLKHMLICVACDIYQSFESQINLFTADGGRTRALEKLAEDARDRMIDYFVKYPIEDNEELTQKKLIQIMLKGILLGESKHYSVAGAASGLTHSGHTLENEQSKTKVNTGKLFRKVGLVEIKGNGDKGFKHSTHSKGKCKSRKYGYRRKLQFLQEEVNELQFQEETKSCEDNEFRHYDFQLNLSCPEKLKVFAKNLSDSILQSTPEVMGQTVREISSNTNLAVSYLEELRQNQKDTETEKQKLIEERERNFKEREMNFQEIENLNRRERDCNKKIKEKEHEVMMLKQQLATFHGEQKENVWNVARCVETFSGRMKELQDLHVLVNSRPGRFVVVHGLGGVGKTELVRKYAETYRKSYNGNCLWVNAATSTTLTQSFHEIAQQLNISVGQVESEQTAAKVFAHFVCTPCLFIFDNVLRSAEVCNFIPKFHPEKRIYSIFISRGKAITKRNTCFEVTPFSERSAVEFIKNMLDLQEISKQDMDMIEDLVRKLDYLPLALQQAVDYILEDCDTNNPFPIMMKYLKLLDRDPTKVLAKPEDDYDEYSDSVLTTWDITLERIKDSRDSGPLAIEVLNVISYYDNERVPANLFLSLKHCNASWENLGQALKILKKYSVIRMFGEEKDKVINVHNLMQIVLRQRHKGNNDSTKILSDALELLKIYLKEDKQKVGHSLPGLQAVCHAEEAWKHATNCNNIKIGHLDVLRLLIETLMAYHRCSNALVYIEEYLSFMNQLHDADSLEVIECLLLQAKAIILKSWQDDEDLAEDPVQAYSSLLRLYQSKLSNEKKFLHYWYDMARILHQIGLAERACQEYRNVLEEQRRNLGCEHADTVHTQQSLASALCDLGLHEEALAELQGILETQSRMERSAISDADMLSTRAQIALNKCYLGQRQEALQELLFVWEKRCNILGKDHHDTVTTATDVIFVIDCINNYGKAVDGAPILHKKKKQNVAQANAFHRQLEEASALCSVNDEEGTLTALNNILKRQTSLYGENHSEVLRTRKIKAKVLYRFGRNFDALQILENIRILLEQYPHECSNDLEDVELTIAQIKADLNIEKQQK